MKAKKIIDVKSLEKYYKKTKESGYDVVWRISETPNWYNIQVEIEGLNGGSEVAYYQTGNWSEIVEFCSTHYNPGYDTLCGLGCTDSQLANATIDYIHSLGKKLKHES